MRALVWLPVLLAIGCTPVQQQEVPVETTDCAGNTGAVLVPTGPVYRVEDFDCGPGYPGIELKLVLVRTHATSFDAFTITDQQLREQFTWGGTRRGIYQY